jgi:hypothetical protein
MYVHLTSTWMVGLILFIFSIKEFIQPLLVSTESEHSSFQNKGPSYGSNTQNDSFLRNDYKDLD